MFRIKKKVSDTSCSLKTTVMIISKNCHAFDKMKSYKLSHFCSGIYPLIARKAQRKRNRKLENKSNKETEDAGYVQHKEKQ